MFQDIINIFEFFLITFKIIFMIHPHASFRCLSVVHGKETTEVKIANAGRPIVTLVFPADYDVAKGVRPGEDYELVFRLLSNEDESVNAGYAEHHPEPEGLPEVEGLENVPLAENSEQSEDETIAVPVGSDLSPFPDDAEPGLPSADDMKQTPSENPAAEDKERSAAEEPVLKNQKDEVIDGTTEVPTEQPTKKPAKKKS